MTGPYSNRSMTLYVRLPARGGDVIVPLLTPVVCHTGDVLHAAHSDHVLGWLESGSLRVTWDTACGHRRAHPVTVEVEAGRQLVPWPPYVAPLRDLGLSRCQGCHEATGELRPRVTMRRGVAS